MSEQIARNWESGARARAKEWDDLKQELAVERARAESLAEELAEARIQADLACQAGAEAFAQRDAERARADAATARAEALAEIATVFAEQEFIADEFGVCWWVDQCNYGQPNGKYHRWKGIPGKHPALQQHHDPTCPNVRLKAVLEAAAPPPAALGVEREGAPD